MANLEIKAVTDDLEESVELAEKLRAIKPAAPTDSKISFKSLVGTWVNCNQNTRSIVRIEFSEKDGSLIVNVFGACHPTPCNWGKVPGTVYAKSVCTNEVVAFSAFYDHGFAERIVTGRLDSGTLIVETFTKFKDKSGRSNYYMREYLHK